MKFHLTFIFLLITPLLFAQQNLVPNPSFENFHACPYTDCQIYRATGWNSYNASPDYCNACGGVGADWGIPYNGYGYQYPATGNAYAAICCGPPSMSGSEMIGRELMHSLTIGQKYFVSFKTVASDNPSANYGIDKLGVLFSTISHAIDSATVIINCPGWYTYELVNNFAHIYSNQIILDTMNWTTVSGSFIADSAYQYIILGVFFDSANVNVQMINPYIPAYGATYLIDDIYVGTDSLADIEHYTAQNIINIYPNPATDELTIDFAMTDKGYFELYDMIGAKRKSVTLDNGLQTKRIDLTNIDSGVYFYSVFDRKGDKIKTDKIIIIK